ncbi:MAG: SusF/SusE family outer membrane protein, partial [Chryseobacterium sp.]|nr:SusF/SusE family outer membrane protein [Chryseobacterium sp.]
FPSNPALTLSWESAGYTAPTEIKYDVEISATQTFETPYVLTSLVQSIRYATFTAKELNESAKKIGLIPYEAQNMYFRVKSYLGDNKLLLQTSNVSQLIITPYQASPTYDYIDLYLIGDATAGGWDNSASNDNLYPLLKTAGDKTKYSYTGFFKTGGFKMIQVKGSWDLQYGLGTASGTGGSLDTSGGSGNISIASDGYYKLEISTTNLSYTLTKLSDPATTYNNVSIIGNGNDWNTDIQLTKSSFDPHVWTKTLNISSGEIKFRANNAWDVSWGSDSEFFGTATIGGANIPVTDEWNYNVYFNDFTGAYSIIPVK